jgi:ATP phosphoribosyltransferase regulatory subunit
MTGPSGPASDGLAAPRGARDLLPHACRRRRELVRALVGTFERWGYEQVATPLVESFEMLGRGLSEADRARCVRFIEAGSGELVALRSDVTPQIARMLSRRLGGELPSDVVYRWCYAADVVRQPTAERDATEHHQVGVELVGDADTAADVELVALCDEALRDLGLAEHRIDLAHGRIASSLVDALGLDADGIAAVYAKLARKDESGTLAVLAEHGVTGARAAAVASLCGLYGGAEVLERASAELGALRGLAELRAAVDGLARAGHVLDRVTLDLGEVRGFDYYTGLRMRVWAPRIPRPIVRGGRYDGLFARYGAPRAATGFAIDLDALEAALDGAGKGDAPPRTRAHLVALASTATDANARAVAAEIAAGARQAGARAWVHPSAMPAPGAERREGDGAERRGGDLGRARATEIAEEGGATELSWIEPDGQGGTRIERSTRTADGWRTISADESADTPERDEP